MAEQKPLGVNNKFSWVPLRLIKFKDLQVITTGKHANEFLAEHAIEAIDLDHTYSVNLKLKTGILIRDPRQRLISGLFQEWHDVIWPHFKLAGIAKDKDKNLSLISHSFNEFINSTLFDTVSRHDATHVAPWLHIATRIHKKAENLGYPITVFNFEELGILLSKLNLSHLENKYKSIIDHKKLSENFTDKINNGIALYLKDEYKFYNYLSNK